MVCWDIPPIQGIKTSTSRLHFLYQVAVTALTGASCSQQVRAREGRRDNLILHLPQVPLSSYTSTTGCTLTAFNSTSSQCPSANHHPPLQAWGKLRARKAVTWDWTSRGDRELRKACPVASLLFEGVCALGSREGNVQGSIEGGFRTYAGSYIFCYVFFVLIYCCSLKVVVHHLMTITARRCKHGVGL